MHGILATACVFVFCFFHLCRCCCVAYSITKCDPSSPMRISWKPPTKNPMFYSPSFPLEDRLSFFEGQEAHFEAASSHLYKVLSSTLNKRRKEPLEIEKEKEVITTTFKISMVKSDNKIKPEPSSSTKKKYKGIRMRRWGSWVSEIRAPNQKTRIWLGSYSTPDAAARAYDAALLCLKGPTANLNFPITPSLLSLPDTILSPKSIQRVAAAAAAADSYTTTTLSSPSHTPPSSSPLDHPADNDTALTPCWTDFTICGAEEQTLPIYPPIELDGLQSPKSIDQMPDAWTTSFDLQLNEEFYEEGDIHLWSFC